MSARSKGRIHEREVEQILNDAGILTERARNQLVFFKASAHSIRHDWFRAIDIVGIHPDLRTLLVQVTTSTGDTEGTSARANQARLKRRKIEANLAGHVSAKFHEVQVWVWGRWLPPEIARRERTPYAFRIHRWDPAKTGAEAWTYVAEVRKDGKIAQHPAFDASASIVMERDRIEQMRVLRDYVLSPVAP